MKAEVESLLVNAVRLDPSITSDMLDAVLAILRGERPVHEPDVEDERPLYKRDEIARRFRITKQTVSNWAKYGRLDPVKNRRGQTIGYTRASVGAIIRGER